LFRISGLDLDLVEGRIFWTLKHTFGGNGAIWRSDLDGDEPVEIVSGLNKPRGIAVDPVGRKIYWTDDGSDLIQRAELDGTQVTNLISANNPIRVEVDPIGGKIYWAETSPGKFRRANLDGSNIELIWSSGLNGGAGGGMALDLTANKIYWPFGATNSIWRMNLDGSNPEDLGVGPVSLPYGLALDVAQQKLYWVDDSEGNFRANADGSNVELSFESGATRGIALAIFGFCGDNVVDQFEQCDDGNQNGGDSCTAECLLPLPDVPVLGFSGQLVFMLVLVVSTGALFATRRRLEK
jgi:cysteine-rich repeat protein